METTLYHEALYTYIDLFTFTFNKDINSIETMERVIRLIKG